MLSRTSIPGLLTAALLLVGTAQAAELTITRDGSSGRVVAVRVPGEPATSAGATLSEEASRAKALAFLSEHGELWGLKDAAAQLVLVPDDVRGTAHPRFVQVEQGLPVLGAELIVHLNTAGSVYAVTGKLAQVTGSASPAMDEAFALDEGLIQWQADFLHFDEPEIHSARPVWLAPGLLRNKPGDDATLCWEVQVASHMTKSPSDELYYLDASKGQLLEHLSNVRRLERQVYDCAKYPGTPGCVIDSPTYVNGVLYYFGRSESAPERGPYPRSQYPLYYGSNDVDLMHELLNGSNDYWIDTFGRNGPNNMGGLGSGNPVSTISTRAYVHVDNIWTDYCPHRVAAFTTNQSVGFCRGAIVPDVLGHEIAHGTVHYTFTDENGNYVGTPYYGEPGSIEESFVDIVGGIGYERMAMGDYDWKMGTYMDVPPGTYPSLPGGVVRDLKNPGFIVDNMHDVPIPYPDRFHSQFTWCGEADNNGVHHNSTVPSKAFYLLSAGGEFNGCEIAPIGFDAVLQLYYRAMTAFFTSTVTFNEAVVGLELACQDLYGVSHPEYLASVTAALQAVEMDQPGYCSGIPEVAPACAVIGGGAAYSGLATGFEDSLFTTNESVWLHSQTGVPGRRVLVHRLVPGTEPGLWEEIPSGADTLSVTVGMDGVLAASLGSLPAGAWTLLLDGDHDGFWQPWADQQLSVTITPAPPRVTGLTARVQPGENPPARIRLDWNPLPDAPAQTQYQVEGDTLPQFPLPQLLTTTPDTTWTDSLSVTPPPLRLYRVKAVTP